MKCTFSKAGEDGKRIHCNKPADKVIREKWRNFSSRHPVCLKHYIAWTRHLKAGYGLGCKPKGETWD